MEKRMRDSPDRNIGESESMSSQSDIIQLESSTMEESHVLESSTMESHVPEISTMEFSVLDSSTVEESHVLESNPMESPVLESSTMESHVDEKQSLEVEKTETEDLKDSIKTLTEKLSAALANVSAKDELVKQHVKVAEEAVAGWEKAENESVELKEKLEVVKENNKVLDDRVSHLDGALKECVRQLRQARDEQEQQIQDAVTERTKELESVKVDLENQILESVRKSEELGEMAESVARENVMLRHELLARCVELEIRTIERDLSTQAAENASKQQLDIIKKVAKLEAECRKLRMLAKSSSSFNDHRSSDSHSDGGERMDSESWTSSTLIEKRSLQGTTSSVEIDLMGDFLEMERLVALPKTPARPESVTEETVVHAESSLAAEIEVLTCRTKKLEEELEKLQGEKEVLESEVKCNREVESTLRLELEGIVCDKAELENKLEKMEVEKAELQISFDIMKDQYQESQDCIQEYEMKLEKVQKEMELANERKAQVESLIISMEAEANTKEVKIKGLEEDVRKEKFDIDELRRKCKALEEEVSLHQENAIKRENIEPKIKQEDIETAAGKLATCQKTITSLGKQLQSLATLEDFLTDTSSIPVTTNGVTNVHKKETFMAKYQPESIKPTRDSAAAPIASSSEAVSSNRGSSEKNRNGFAEVFTRSKDGIHLAI